jgi:hypothetical protein
MNKNISNQTNFELNQFQTNPTPPMGTKTTTNPPLKQPAIANFNKGSARMNYQ